MVHYGLAGHRVFIEETLDRLAVAEVGRDDFRDIGNGDMRIEDTFRLDDGQRTLFAETVTAGEIYFDSA
jgi:hypothetical protein